MTAIAHPNIALVKYWGKADADLNVPAVPSVSVTLDALSTTTRIRFDPNASCDRIELDGSPLPASSSQSRRITACLDHLRQLAGSHTRAVVHSHNDFPTGAGLASSASGFAALVVAAAAALELNLTASDASRLARRSSASAGRSLFGGFAELPAGGIGEDVAASPLAEASHWPLEVVVAICAEGPKPVGSTRGMLDSAASSPYYPAWVETAVDDARIARTAIANRHFAELATVAEASCLKMHAVMHTTRPPLIYWNAATMAVLEQVRQLQQERVEVFFTMDAGPQVKAICAPGSADRVAAQLAAVPGVHRILRSGLGGPARVLPAP